MLNIWLFWRFVEEYYTRIIRNEIYGKLSSLEVDGVLNSYSVYIRPRTTFKFDNFFVSYNKLFKYKSLRLISRHNIGTFYLLFTIIFIRVHTNVLNTYSYTMSSVQCSLKVYSTIYYWNTFWNSKYFAHKELYTI